MILRPGCRNSVRCLQARWVIPQCRKPIRYYSSSEKPPFELPKAYLEKLQAELKPRLEPVVLRFQNASRTLKKMSRDVGDTKEALKCASAAINELTGYTHIEQVKRKVTEQAKAFEVSREQVQAAKREYERAIETRSSTQREINELLQRKHSWTGEDVTRFTELYRLEHDHARAEASAKEAYQRCEKQMDREYMALAQSIMERYHEEQLWSDKIRSVSTYGTWALMVVNLILFVAVQTIFEPYKRKRLTDNFEQLLIAKVNEEEAKFKQLVEERDQSLLSQLVSISNGLVESVAEQQQQQTLLQQLQQHLLMEPPATAAEQPPPPAEEKMDTAAVSSSHMVVSKKNLILYSIESAVAGGLLAALAMSFWR